MVHRLQRFVFEHGAAAIPRDQQLLHAALLVAEARPLSDEVSDVRRSESGGRLRVSETALELEQTALGWQPSWC